MSPAGRPSGTFRLSCAALAWCAFAACSAPSVESTFDDVRGAVVARTGAQVEWSHDSPEDGAVAAAARALLDGGLTADAAVQIALLNNRDLRATFEELGIAQAELVQAGLLQNPVFSGNTKFSFSGATEIEFGVTRSFLDVAFIPLARAVAAEHLAEVQLVVTAKAVDLAARVRERFAHVVADESLLKLRRSEVEARGAAADLALRLRAAGNIREVDAASLRVLHAQARLDLADAEVAALENREALTVLLGLWGPDAAWRVGETLDEVPPAESDLTDLESRAIAASLELAAGRRRLQAEANAAGLTEWSSLIPDAEAGVAVKKEVDGTWGLGPALTVPLPIFDQGQGRVAAAQARLRRGLSRHVELAVEIRSAARVARARLVAARNRALFLRDSVLPLRRDSTADLQLQYNGMLTGAFQLIEGKAAEIEASLQVFEARRDYWLARGDVSRLTSGVRPADHGSGRARESMTTPVPEHF